ncbi:MAG TPA: hypothetical protein VJM12_07225 [Pyrinomonadaceae bacterium]|nr:hypothetical protein [Pyrinomonadaceae bacterium]
MIRKHILVTALLTSIVGVAGCSKSNPTNTPTPTNTIASTPAASRTPGPLPPRGFRAQIAIIDPPTKLGVGQRETINVKIKNASDVFWWARGGETNDRNDNKFYIAIGNRWLDESGKLLSEMDGRLGISKDMRAGEELELPLLITAPAKPGEYILEVDMVQEQVSWFGDKGSPTARSKISVVR